MVVRMFICLCIGSALMPVVTNAQKNSQRQSHHHRSTPVRVKPLTTTELTIVDAQGRPRLRLSAASKSPTLQMLNEKGIWQYKSPWTTPVIRRSP